MKRLLFLFAYALLALTTLAQSSHTLSGCVTDRQSGETLIGVTVVDLRSGKGTVTNLNGRFSLTLKDDSVALRISFVGYQPQFYNFRLSANRTINAALVSAIEMQEVVITAERVGDHRASQMSAIDVPIEQLKAVPVLFGEADIVKAIQLLPGVQSGSEGSAGMYVRGGGPDENLFLLDGVPLYNVNHMGGFFSAFNTDAVKNVTLYKGSFPARFGGRVSSVLDVTTNNGNNSRLHGNASVGFISAKFNLEGPLVDSSTTFCLSARRTYADFLLQPLVRRLTHNNDYKVRAGYYFYDLNGKLTHTFSDRSRLYASYYMGADDAYMRVRTLASALQDEYLRMDNRWGNIVGSMRWNYVLSPKLFLNLTGAFTRYQNNISLDYETDYRDANGNPQQDDFVMDYHSGIRDFTAKADFDYTPNPNHDIKFGLSAIAHQFRPEVASARLDYSDPAAAAGSMNIDTISQSTIPAFESNLFAEDDWSLNDIFKVNYGLNLSLFGVNGVAYPSLQPRLSGRVLITPDLSAKLGYARMTQYMHLLSTTSVSMPTDLWVPVTATILPMQSNQFAAGLFYSLERVADFSVEGYYKTMRNVIEYRDGASFWGSSESWEQKVCMGDGWAYGVEFLVQRSMGDFTGWVGYTWSRTMRLFNRPGQELNNGNPFPAKYDRRHDLSIVASYQVTKNIDLSATWVFSTGNTATLAYEEYTQAYDTPEGYRYDLPTFGDYSITQFDNSLSYTSGRNNFRMPNYHRMDISANFRRQLKHCSRVINLSVYNLYNRKNPYMIYESADHTYQGYNAALVQISLFPILPSIAYTLNF